MFHNPAIRRYVIYTADKAALKSQEPGESVSSVSLRVTLTV